MADDIYRTQLLQDIHGLREEAGEARQSLESAEALALRLYQAYREISMYHPDDAPHKAVYVVATCKAMLEPFARPYGVVEAFNEARRRLEEYDQRKAIENG